MLRRVGIRELRDNATRYLAADDVLAVERHGSLVGYFVPVRPPDERSSIDDAVERLRREVAPGRLDAEHDGVGYVVNPGWLRASDLTAFFTEWPRRPADEQIDSLVARSNVVVLAMDGDEIVGFASAISDGHLFAYIPFVEVRYDRRGRGIGTTIMRTLLAELEGVHGVDLSCDAELVPFYRRLGLQPVVAMIRRDSTLLGG